MDLNDGLLHVVYSIKAARRQVHKTIYEFKETRVCHEEERMRDSKSLYNIKRSR